MAFRNNSSLVLYFFSLHLLLFSSKVRSYDCSPSSCGTIPNISYPFRLKNDPENCGDPKYELDCENNRTTIVYLNSKRFIVLSITYHNFTIRLVDPGLVKYQDSSFCPLHYLLFYDVFPPYNYYAYDFFDLGFGSFEFVAHDLNEFMISISCSSRIRNTTISSMNGVTDDPYQSQGVYHERALCGDNENNLSNSFFSAQHEYSYVYVGSFLSLREIKHSCSVKSVTLVSKNASEVGYTHFPNYSYGFELLWYSVFCGNCFGPCHLNQENGTIICMPYAHCSLWKPSTILKVRCWKEYWY